MGKVKDIMLMVRDYGNLNYEEGGADAVGSEARAKSLSLRMRQKFAEIEASISEQIGEVVGEVEVEEVCMACNGSGEGLFDGTACGVCRGYGYA